MIRRIERDGGARFQVYGRANGRKVYVGTFDSKREATTADEEHRVTRRKIDAGELPPEVDDKRTLQAAVDEWLKSLEANGSRSRRAYGEFMRYQVTSHLGTVPIANITKAHLVRWRDARAIEFAPTTVNSALAALSSACSYFVERDWIKTNPCYGVAQVAVRPRSFNWIKTRPELERLLMVCPDELRDMVAVAVGTGMRLDEMLHLAWDDVDLDLRLITIQRGRQGTVKGGRIRHIPILDSMLALFKMRTLKRGSSALVFPGPRGRTRTKTPVQCAYKAALKRAGLDTKLRWHDLRHTCASWWVLGGGDIFRLSRMLGHASVTVTQKTYAHLAPEAWNQDYHRLAFHIPSEPAKVYEFHRGANGKMLGKRAIAVDARETRSDTVAKSV
jgi:integrase/recombinase XerD